MWLPLMEQQLLTLLEYLSYCHLSGVCRASLVLCVVFGRTLFVFLSLFFFLLYCLSFNIWLPLCCIQTVLSVLQHLVTPLLYSDCIVCPSTSGYPFGVFRLYCLSFNIWLPLCCIQTVLSVLQHLVTPLLYSDCIVCPSTSGYPFGVFRHLSVLQHLVTPLVYSDCIVCPSTSGYPFGVFRLYCLSFYLQLGYPFGVFRLYCLSFYLQLLVTPLVYSDCIVCPSIYNFWLPLWCIQTVRLYCLLSIYNFWLPLWCIQTVLSVLLFTTSGYPFGVFRLYCLSFDLQLLVTPLVYSDCIVCPSIYNFWLPLWCIQTVLSVLLFTTSGYPFGVFRLYCLS